MSGYTVIGECSAAKCCEHQQRPKNPLNDTDLKEFVALEKTKPETEKSWNIDFADIQTNNYDLSVKNPNLPEEAALRTPLAILEEMELLDEETNEILSSIKEMI
jgi:type I restriction enzyme M protein